ncbi:MAG: ribonuclease H-like domain-containing protein [Candidatus Azambacteria bacterium]|nr:ribonuclease H-like domain-containing protein [Candidatus Azambacteria bacterium]
MSDAVTVQEAKRRNDKRVVKSIYKLINQADFVITHNGDRFDIKELNWQFLLNNLTPNNRYKSIDTLKKCKEIFGVPSYAMDYLCQELGYNGKHHTDMSLWEGVEAGNQTSINDMSAYCSNDIFMLEDLYLRTRGWYKTHPSFTGYMDMYRILEGDLEEGEYLCPRCGQSIYKTKFTKKWRTPAGYIYKSTNCPHCGCVLRKTERMPGQRIEVK